MGRFQLRNIFLKDIYCFNDLINSVFFMICTFLENNNFVITDK